MELNAFKNEQFAEALYFLLMASPAADRVKRLGARHGLSGRALRGEVLNFAKRWAQTADGPLRAGDSVRQAI